MNNKRGFDFSGLAKADRILIGLSAVGLIVAALFLFNEDLYNRFIGGAIHDDTSKPLMGVVTEKVNDTRYKNSALIFWVNTRNKQNVRAGDSLFAGVNSRAHVTLKDGNEMTLDQNSMVVFNELKITDLNMGNFRFKVEGKMVLSVQGQPTTVEGSGSDIQIIVPKEKGAKPQVRLLRGSASIQVQGKPRQQLTPQKVETLPIVVTEEAVRQIASTLNPEQPAQPKPADVPSAAPAPAPAPRRLQLYDVFEAKEDKSLAPRVQIANEARSLLPLDEHVSLISSRSEPITLDQNGARVTLSASGAPEVQGYIFEMSANKDFPAEQTRAKWKRDGNLELNFTQPGTFFYRVRGANQKTELTTVSEPVEVVVRPQEIIAPIANDEPKDRRDRPALKIRKPKVAEERRRPTPLKNESASPVKKQIAQDEQSIPASIRKPSAVASSSTKIAPEEKTNQGYTSSRIDFETGTFTVFSPDEKDVGRTNPYAYTLGIRSKHWFNERSGFEGIARVKAGNLNETASGINPLDLEARYHYKLHSSWLGRTNFSLLGGVEVYRNIGRGYFAQKYDLGKLGFALDFPVGNRWDAGGDVVFGIGADQTKKYEAVGRLNYYFRRRYSLGVGYRLYLLEAGSDQTAPLDYPYKETWGEGFFVFRFHY